MPSHFPVTAGAVPSVDSTRNNVSSEVLGNKTDTAINTKDDVSALMRYAKGVLDAVGIGAGVFQGSVYYGVVTAVPGANQFTIATLAGLGAGKFAGTNPYRAFVLRDAGGASAAPQGEQQSITAYTTATGAFTTDAFTAAVAVGDEVLIIHPRLAEVLTILGLHGVPTADAALNVYMRDVLGIKTDTAILVKDNVSSAMRYLKGLLDANVPTVKGRAQIFQKAITSAANAGDVTIATITTQACLIESIVVKAVTAAQVDLTSAGVFGGASKVITFLSAVDAAKANIDAIDEQIAWLGSVEFAAAGTIVMSLAGTGVTAVNLLVTIKYRACVSGGYLA
jgi:hypothetical protein